MSLRTSVLSASAGFLLAAGWSVAGPSGPALAEDTITTFTVSGAGIGMNGPTAKDLGAGVTGGTLTAGLGAVTATDNRAALGAGWTASASLSQSFVNQDIPGAPEIDTVTYSPGLATATTGQAAFAPGLPGALTSTGMTAYSAVTSVGNNSATWNPTITVTIPPQAIAGDYSGIITHSVS
jgi:hypothetical protein